MIQLALSQYGIKEIAGEQDNPEIKKYFTELGFKEDLFKDETAWCSAFMNWVAKKNGRKYSGQLNARSWLDVGAPTPDPNIGDVVVLWRQDPQSWKGHVGLYIREDKDTTWILGGNQGNRVCIAPYPKKRVLGYRRI